MSQKEDDMKELLKEMKTLMLGTKNILVDVLKKEEDRLNKFVDEMEELARLHKIMEEEKKNMEKKDA
jgi:hypothetical protein